MKRQTALLFLACVLSAPLISHSQDPAFPQQPTPPVLSPEEELKTFQLPPGYSMELVLSEPDIRQPVQCIFDGDGRMYVAEMRTYMDDIDGTNELSIGGNRVSRHESTKGDGHFDKHTDFADNLLLPRTVLPLDKDRVIIQTTNTNDLYTYRDTNGTGSENSKELFYAGGSVSSNMEHQASGLMWAMDNWIYSTYNGYRLRWNPKGATLKESTAPNGGQWGVAQDDNGKLWWSNAGAEKGLWHFQTPVLYGAIDASHQFDPSFMEVWPAVGMADFQGGLPRVRMPDKTLNHFTGCGGQEVIRTDRMPADVYGDVLLPEPVGRLIRLAKVTVKDGVTYLENPYQANHSEFIRSTDPYFRPINITTGPDGYLYIVDMYRGIIQEGNWVTPGSYLRKVVQQYGFDKNVGRGRIWRLVYKGMAPGPQPHLFEESPAQLVAHLDSPNGWYRDEAQKQLVLRQDNSVAPELTKMARTDPNYLARMHALWTLEGLGALDPKLVREKMKDAKPEVRAAAIRVSESLLKAGDLSLKPDVLALAKDPDPSVVLQTIGTAKVLNWPNWQSIGPATIAASTSAGVKEIGTQLLYTPRQFEPRDFSASEIKLLQHGQAIYQQLCFACHGVQGAGMPMDGQPPGTTIAPPLSGSHTILGPREGPISVLLHGVAGPVNGKTYDAIMPPLGDNTDEWIASVLSFVRNSFGNNAPPITPAEVAAIRTETLSRTQPWTLEEMKIVVPQPLTDRAQWKATASPRPEAAALAIDGNMGTQYDTGAPQTPGEWFQIELPQETAIAGLSLFAAKSDEFPRVYKVELSTDGTTWGKPVAQGHAPSYATTQIRFNTAKAKFIRITQTGSVKDHVWSIKEVQLLGPAKFAAPALAASGTAR